PAGFAQWHAYDCKPVSRPQLAACLAQRPAHSGETQVAREKALIRDLRNRARVSRYPTLFLQLDETLQAPRPDASGRSAPRDLIQYFHTAFPDQVIVIDVISV